jgi:hypothetical protein
MSKPSVIIYDNDTRAEGTDTLGDVAYLNGCGFKYTSDKLGVGLT